MVNYLTLYWNELASLVYEMSPWLLLGFGIAGILHVLFSEEKINRFLGEASTKHVFRAAIFGIPLPLCSCGVIPTGISMYRSGASKGSSIAFLISTPQTGVDSIMVTYSLLGLPFAILRPIIALITGVLGGVTANFFERAQNETGSATTKDPAPTKSSTLGTHTTTACHVDRPMVDVQGALAAPKPNKMSQLSWFAKACEAVHYAMVDFFGDVSRSLLLGLLVAALIAVLVPNDFFDSYLKSDLIGMIVILVVSIPLYVCATSSVPVAAVLIAKGLSPGAAIVFLMAGPATNAATMTMIGSVMGRRALFTYLGTIITGALASGIVIDYLLPSNWFIPIITEHAHTHTLLPHWLQAGASIIFVVALAYAFARQLLAKRWFAKKKEKEAIVDRNVILLSVEGMTCGHCKRTVEEAIRQLDGVEHAKADLGDATVTIHGSPDLTQIHQCLESLGYKVGE